MAREPHFVVKYSSYLGTAIKLVLYILKQLFASVSVNSGGYLPRRSGSVNIHRYSPPLRRIIVKYCFLESPQIYKPLWHYKPLCTITCSLEGSTPPPWFFPFSSVFVLETRDQSSWRNFLRRLGPSAGGMALPYWSLIVMQRQRLACRYLCFLNLTAESGHFSVTRFQCILAGRQPAHKSNSGFSLLQSWMYIELHWP